MLRLTSPNDCRFCSDQILEPTSCLACYMQFTSTRRADPHETMRHSLYAKYSSSQNYHYTKDMNEILQNQRTQATIRHRDMACLDEDAEDYLNRLYVTHESQDKLSMLGEYYKFHNDIPRMFMLPAIISLNWYHDRKRRLEYFRIARLIEQENNNNPDKPPKGIVGDSPALVRESENLTEPVNDDTSDLIVKKDRILDELSWLKHEPSQLSQKQPPETKPPSQTLKLQLKKLSYLDKADAAGVQQQIKNLQAVFKERLAKQTEKPPEKPKSTGKWKKELKLDENLLRACDSVELNNHTGHTGRNLSNRNQPSDRITNQSQKVQSTRPLRPSLVNILQIIKNPQHKRKPSKSNKNELSKGDHVESMSQTPRQVQTSLFIPPRAKDKRNQSLLAIDRISTFMSSKPKVQYSQPSISKPSSFAKSQLQSQLCGNITPRAAQVNQSPITSMKGSPMPATQMQFKQKVQMLELKVLTDLQQLQSKRQPTSKVKKHCTLQLDSVIRAQDPKSLTQRLLTSEQSDFNTMRLKSIYQRKKEQPHKQHYPSGTQSQRGQESYLIKPAIDTSTGKGNQIYYNNVQPQSQVSTFVTHNQSSQSSATLKHCHQKSHSFKGQVKASKPDFDSQLFKAAINLAQRIQNTGLAQPQGLPLSARQCSINLCKPAKTFISSEQLRGSIEQFDFRQPTKHFKSEVTAKK